MTISNGKWPHLPENCNHQHAHFLQWFTILIEQKILMRSMKWNSEFPTWPLYNFSDLVSIQRIQHSYQKKQQIFFMLFNKEAKFRNSSENYFFSQIHITRFTTLVRRHQPWQIWDKNMKPTHVYLDSAALWHWGPAWISSAISSLLPRVFGVLGFWHSSEFRGCESSSRCLAIWA